MPQRSRGEGHKKVTATNVGTNAGSTATLTGVTGQKIAVTHISGSGDAAALVTIESPASTVLWRKRFAAAFTISENFSYGELEAADGASILVKISASTSNSEVNIAGLQIGS